MMKSGLKKYVLAAAISLSITPFVYADDSAPVFDADNYPPQFDGQPYDDSGSGDAPPPSQSRPGPQAQAYAPASNQSLSLDQRIARVEQQVNNIQQTDDGSKLNNVQSQLQALRGQVEDLTHQLQQLKNQQIQPGKSVEMADANVAMKSTPDDTILSKPAAKAATKDTAAKTVAAKAATKTADQQQPNVAEEQQTYQTAYNLIKAKKYNEAVAALQKMLQKYPTGQFAANAHYWLGELYGLMGNNEKSVEEFGNVVKNYADSPKVSDAQLKLGLLYAAAFKWGEAKSAFKKVINHYPGTASARLAQEQLKQIKDAGH